MFFKLAKTSEFQGVVRGTRKRGTAVTYYSLCGVWDQHCGGGAEQEKKAVESSWEDDEQGGRSRKKKKRREEAVIG